MKSTLEQASDIKGRLRKDILRKRDAIPLPVRKIKDAAITERLLALDVFRNSPTVAFYASFRSEASTEAAMTEALRQGKAVLLPKVNEEDMTLSLYEIKSAGDVSPGYMGIPEPAAEEDGMRFPEDAGLVILPGAAFDARGYRIGYGKGCYDRMLGSAGEKPALVALAYEEQIVPEVPAQAHDVRVDIIVTDRRTIHCSDGHQED